MIYLSGAITGATDAEWDFNLLRGRSVAIEMARRGLPYFSPHLNFCDHNEPRLQHLTWQNYMDMELPILSRCSGMLMIDGWEDSKGAVIERQFAIDIGIPVFYTIQEILDHVPSSVKGDFDSLEAANIMVGALRRQISTIQQVANREPF